MRRRDARLEEKSVRKQGGNVTSYFCNPDREVLGFVVGPVTSERLKKSCDKALDFFEQSLLYRAGSDRAIFARKYHRQIAHPDLMSRFDEYNTQSSWKDGKYKGRPVAAEAKRAAKATFVAALELKTGSRESHQSINLSKEIFPARFTTYGGEKKRNHLKTQSEEVDKLLFAEHSMLTEVPMIRIEELEKHVFQVLVGQEYSPRTRQHDWNYEKFVKAKEDNKYVLAIVDKEKPATFAPNRGRKRTFETEFVVKHHAIRRHAKTFAIIKFTQPEFFTLLNDLDHEPVNRKGIKWSDGAIRFVLFDQSGHAVKTLGTHASPARIGNAMKEIQQDGG